MSQDTWVPLHIRGNALAERVWRETEDQFRRMSNECAALRERLRLADSEVSYLKSVSEVARADGYRAGIEAAAKVFDEYAISARCYGLDATKHEQMAAYLRALAAPAAPKEKAK